MENADVYDVRDHVILGYWPEAHDSACLALNSKDNFKRFVACYGYDPETGEWSHGSYFSDPVRAWNHADPEILESLSEPIYVKDVLEDMQAACSKDATAFDVEDYASDCMKVILLDSDWSISTESADMEEWWREHR